MLEVNPGVTEAKLRKYLELNPDGPIESWDLMHRGLQALPVRMIKLSYFLTKNTNMKVSESEYGLLNRFSRIWCAKFINLFLYVAVLHIEAPCSCWQYFGAV